MTKGGDVRPGSVGLHVTSAISKISHNQGKKSFLKSDSLLKTAFFGLRYLVSQIIGLYALPITICIPFFTSLMSNVGVYFRNLEPTGWGSTNVMHVSFDSIFNTAI